MAASILFPRAYLHLEAASKLGDKLIVALNSEEWLVNKKGKFLCHLRKEKIIENLQMVNEVIGFDDDHSGSCTRMKIKSNIRMKIISMVE